MAIAQSPVYDAVYRFLVKSPTPEEIIAFRASAATQERVNQLLESNREGRLTLEEQAELDEFENVNHFVSMLKAYAYQQLADKQ